MGTSTSHPSPSTLGWRAAKSGYVSEGIPTDRILAEVWRASRSQPNPIGKYLTSPLVFRCQQAVRESESALQALQTVTRLLSDSKENSIVTELAKRAVAPAFSSERPVQAWREHLFAQVTSYLVSRDLPGFVGDAFRNKTLTDHLHFKDTLTQRTRQVVGAILADPASPRKWRQYVRRALALLAETR